MSKTSFFKHNYNALHSQELQDILVYYGVEGIGIYWCIIEELYSHGGKMPMASLRHIAFALHADEELVRNLVIESPLFAHDDGDDDRECYFWSPQVLDEFQAAEERRAKKREAAMRRWGADTSAVNAKMQRDEWQDAAQCNGTCSAVHGATDVENANDTCGCNADTMHMQCTCNAHASQGEKREENKENKERTKENKENKEERKEEDGDFLQKSLSETGVSDPEKFPFSLNSFILFWNTEMQNAKAAIPQIKSIQGKRRNALAARCREHGRDALVECVRKAAANDFLNGKNNRNWIASFDWLFMPSNFQKVLEGNYDKQLNTNMQSNGNGTEKNEELKIDWRRRYETQSTSAKDYYGSF